VIAEKQLYREVFHSVPLLEKGTKKKNRTTSNSLHSSFGLIQKKQKIKAVNNVNVHPLLRLSSVV